MNDNEVPQTTTVFKPQELVFNDHDWQQEGYMITDVCSPSKPTCQHVGIPIPSGKMLTRDKKGAYDLVNERS